MRLQWIPALFLLSGFGILHSQHYLNSTSTWYEHYTVCGFTGTCVYYDFKREISGDTVIHGLTYHRITTSGVYNVYDLFIDEIVFTEPFVWDNEFIREEEYQWYWYRPHNDTEVLLADFDLMTGDTAVDSYCQNPLMVDHIDTVFMVNEPRRRFWFHPGNNHHNYLVEGVGSSTGLFRNPCSEIGIEAGGALNCFHQDDDIVIFDSTSECAQSTFAFTIPTQYQSISVYPNPATDGVYIMLPPAMQSDEIIFRVFNLQGQQVAIQYQLLQNQYRIHLENESSGMYFIVVQSGDRYGVGKVVKQ